MKPFSKKASLDFRLVLFSFTHKIAAVGPAGLIQVFDQQVGLAGEERLKGDGFCFIFVRALKFRAASADSSYRGKQVPDAQTGVHISIVGL